jgi:hypothetical protein
MAKPKGSLADQLKGVKDKLALDAASEAAARKRLEEDKKAAAERARMKAFGDRPDDQVFLDAMTRVGTAEVTRKFDQSPPPASARPTEPAKPPATDEDLFSAALGRLGK